MLCRDYEEASVDGPQANAPDNFGFAVAMSDDVLAVGAPTEDDETSLPNGVVRIYRRSNSTWVLEDTLTAPASITADAPPSFGAAVAIEGDVLFVGAPDTSDSRGIVLVYVRTSSAAQDAWGAPVDRLLPEEDLDRFDRFGEAISVDGSTVAIGAPGRGGGTAFVFAPRDVPNKWGEPEVLTQPGTTGFGASLAIRDGRLIVGAPDQTNGRGAAYVFQEVLGAWPLQTTLLPPTPEIGAEFGKSVATDGVRVAIGAPGQSGIVGGASAENVGAAYTVDVRFGNFTELRAANADPNDGFGSSVAMTTGQLVVGAPFEDGSAADFNLLDTANSTVNAGAAYLFDRDGDTWSQLVYIKAVTPLVGENFGASVAIDVNRTVIGVPGPDDGGRFAVRKVLP